MGSYISYFQSEDPVQVALHEDVFEVIISKMTVSDIFANATLVSKAWNRRAKRNGIWFPRYIKGLENDSGFARCAALQAYNPQVQQWKKDAETRTKMEHYEPGEIYTLFRKLWGSMFHVSFDGRGNVIKFDLPDNDAVKRCWIRKTGNQYQRFGNDFSIGFAILDKNGKNIETIRREDGTADPDLVLAESAASGLLEFSKAYKGLFFAWTDEHDDSFLLVSNPGYLYSLYVVQRPAARVAASVNPLPRGTIWDHHTNTDTVIQCQVCEAVPAKYLNTASLNFQCDACAQE